jgi:hypothetical protein
MNPTAEEPEVDSKKAIVARVSVLVMVQSYLSVIR